MLAFGERIIVMNCIWVLRKAKGHGFGRMLLESMIRDERWASGFATIGPEGHWSLWFRREHMEQLGFKPIDFVDVKHKAKHTDRCFKIYLMRLPMNEKSSPPKWDKHTLLEGVSFCLAHPLYNAESLGWLKSWKNYPHPKPRLRKKVKSTLVHFLLMLIGLISDTHDHLKMIEKAVAFFNENNVGMVLHAGDVISPFTARKFKECRSRLILVYGNNDGDRSNLQRAFSEIGAQFYWPAAMLELEGRRILVLHGEDARLVDEIAGKNMFDLILSGHTHEADVKRIKGTLWVNPGEACGYLTGRSTVGLYDSSKHEAEIIEI